MKLIGLINDNEQLIVIDSNYCIIINEKKEVLIEKKSERKFYSENITSLTCVVGKNGVGKTRLLKSIGRDENFNYKFFEKENEIVYQEGKRLLKKEQLVIKFKSQTIYINANKWESRDLTYILYSSALETSTIANKDKKNKFIDITSTSLLSKGTYQSFLKRDSINQISMILDRKNSKIFFEDPDNNYEGIEVKKALTNKPVVNLSQKKIVLQLSDFGEAIYATRLFMFNKTSFSDYDFSSFIETVYKDESNVDVHEINSILASKNKKGKKYLLTVLVKYLSILISSLSEKSIQDFRGRISKLNKKIIVNDLIDQVEDLVVNEADNAEDMSKNLLELKTTVGLLIKLFLAKKDNTFSLVQEDRNILRNLFDQVIYPEKSNDFINDLSQILAFQWIGLSSGEFNMLNIFGRLYGLVKEGILKKDEINRKGCILLIDEVDLGLHPQWQVNWLNLYLILSENLFETLHYQLIISTHSQLLLSDIRDRDIIFFQQQNQVLENNPKTFGQNVQTLLTSGFFIEDTIGEFSKKKIQEISKIVSDPEFVLIRMIDDGDWSNLIQDMKAFTGNNMSKLVDIKKLSVEDSDYTHKIDKIIELKRWVRKAIDQSFRKKYFRKEAKRYFEVEDVTDQFLFDLVFQEISFIGEEFYRNYLYGNLRKIKFSNTEVEINRIIENATNEELNTIKKMILKKEEER